MNLGSPAAAPAAASEPLAPSPSYARSILLIALLLGVVLVLGEAEGFFSHAVFAHARPHLLGVATHGSNNALHAPPRGAPAEGGGGGVAPGAAAFTIEELLYAPASHAEHLARVEAMAAASPASLAPLTAAAQRLLFEWQHPPSCEGRAFLVSQGNDALAGLGSHVHISTHHFAIALERGAIFVWSEDVAHIYTDPETCGEGAGNIECFFLAPSNCSLQDAHAPGASRTSVRFGDAGKAGGYGLEFFHVPRAFSALWEAAGLPVVVGASTQQTDALKYWFRGQVAAYLARPNAATAAAFTALRTRAGALLHAAGPAAPAGAGGRLAAAFPLPPGTLSLHVRHGDKFTEMPLVDTAEYLRAATTLARMHPMALARRGMFMSTEDPGALAAAVAALGADATLAPWALAWYDVPRANSNGPEQLNQFDLPRGQLSRIWLLQLLLALECDGWVGTRGSNWNRLIDELRCVWVPKCQHVYHEVGDFARWEHYSWRA
jgi:hypothetical protein